MTKNIDWGGWTRFGFAYGATIGIIIAILSLLFGTLAFAISPIFGFLGILGFFGFLLIAILGGFVSIIIFLIGRAFYSGINPIRSDYWRVVGIHILGSLPFWLISIIVGVFSGLIDMSLLRMLTPLVGIVVSIMMTLLWSVIFIWIWKKIFNRGIPI